MNSVDLSQYRHVGKILDAHGIRGDVYCLVFSGEVDWALDLESVVLVKGAVKKSFNIKKIKPFKRGFIAQLEGFTNRNIAEEYKSAEVWVSSDVFISENGDSLFLSEIAGFDVCDKQLGNIGKIINFSSNGVQDLLIIESSLGQYEIPFVEDFVEEIDFQNKKINMLLPEGLLQVNDKDYDNHDGSQNSAGEESDED